jgi:hypothetical protein
MAHRNPTRPIRLAGNSISGNCKSILTIIYAAAIATVCCVFGGNVTCVSIWFTFIFYMSRQCKESIQFSNHENVPNFRLPPHTPFRPAGSVRPSLPSAAYSLPPHRLRPPQLPSAPCSLPPQPPFRPILPFAPASLPPHHVRYSLPPPGHWQPPFRPSHPSAPYSLPPHAPFRPSLPSAPCSGSLPPQPPFRQWASVDAYRQKSSATARRPLSSELLCIDV